MENIEAVQSGEAGTIMVEEPEFVVEQDPPVVVDPPAEDPTVDGIPVQVVVPETPEQTIERLRKELVALGGKLEDVAGPVGVAKNKRPGKPGTTKYVLLTKRLASWGRVPQQQADLADILARSFEVGVEIPEAELFVAVTNLAKQYPSLAKSVQDPTYLFRYYRGLDGKDGKHAGFIKRDFLKQV